MKRTISRRRHILHHSLPLAGLLLGLATPPADAQTYLLDFNTTDPGLHPGGASAWNIYAAPADVNGGVIADTSGSTAAGITLSVSGTCSDSGNGEANVFNNPAGGPSWVTTDGSLADTGAAGDYFYTSTSTNGESFTMTLADLPSGETLTLDLWISRVTASAVGFYDFSLDDGATWSGFQVLERDGTPATGDGWDANDTVSQGFVAIRDGNDNARYMYSGSLTVGASGTLLFRTTDTELGGSWSGMGAVRLTLGTSVTPVTITFDPQSQTVTEYRPVTFTVEATGSFPLDVQWHEDGSDIPGTNGFSYTIDQATTDLSGKVYSATVSNSISSETSAGATLTVLADTEGPLVESANTSDGLTITLIFSEEVDYAAAEDPANYTITGSGGPIDVIFASLDLDNRTLTLELESPIDGAATGMITRVEDLVGNLIDPVSSTFTVYGPGPQPGTYLFDFGGTAAPVDPDNSWNLVPDAIGRDDFGILASTVTADGRPSTFALEMISRFNGTNSSGTTASSLYVADATSQSLYGNTEEWQTLTDIYPSFKLTKLDPSLVYNLTFYASRMGAGDNRETEYAVTGDGFEVAYLDPAENIDGTVSINGVVPDGSNEITIDLAPGANNSNGYHFTYLNVLQVDAVAASEDITIVDVRIVGGNLEVDFTAPDGDYVLTQSADLSGGFANPTAPVTVSGGGTVTLSTAMAGTSHFVRVEEVAP